jgi:hypothetical protein
MSDGHSTAQHGSRIQARKFSNCDAPVQAGRSHPRQLSKHRNSSTKSWRRNGVEFEDCGLNAACATIQKRGNRIFNQIVAIAMSLHRRWAGIRSEKCLQQCTMHATTRRREKQRGWEMCDTSCDSSSSSSLSIEQPPGRHDRSSDSTRTM